MFNPLKQIIHLEVKVLCTIFPLGAAKRHKNANFHISQFSFKYWLFMEQKTKLQEEQDEQNHRRGTTRLFCVWQQEQHSTRVTNANHDRLDEAGARKRLWVQRYWHTELSRTEPNRQGRTRRRRKGRESRAARRKDSNGDFETPDYLPRDSFLSQEAGEGDQEGTKMKKAEIRLTVNPKLVWNVKISTKKLQKIPCSTCSALF